MMKYSSLGIHIKVMDIKRSLKFYKALEFIPVLAYGSKEFLSFFKKIPTADEKYNGAIFEVNQSFLEIADGHIAVKPEVFKEPIRNSKVSAFFDIDSIKSLEDICEKEDIEIIVPAKDYPWGMREIVLKDPDGFILVFRQKIS